MSEKRMVIAVLATILGVMLVGCQSIPTEPFGEDQGAYARCLVYQPFMQGDRYTSRYLPRPILRADVNIGTASATSDDFEQVSEIATSRIIFAFTQGEALGGDQDPLNPTSGPPPLGANKKALPNDLDNWLAGDLSEAEFSPFNQFLDCYAGRVDALNFEGRLLRGHILLTMLAEYANFELESLNSTDRKKYAERLLHAITRSELLLEASSLAMGKDLASETKDPTLASLTAPLYYLRSDQGFNNAQRVESILQVAAIGDEVDYQSTYGQLVSAGKSLATVSHNPAALGDVAQQGFRALLKAAQLKLYGASFFQASNRSLNRLPYHGKEWSGPATSLRAADAVTTAEDDFVRIPSSQGRPGHPVGDDQPVGVEEWRLWSVHLSAVCASLGASAGDNDQTCLPTWAQVKAVVTRNLKAPLVSSNPAAEGFKVGSLPEPHAKGAK